MKEWEEKAKEDAKRITEYLRSHGYDTKRAVAKELELDEVDMELALQQEECWGVIKQGVRPDSYGCYVIWI